MQVAFVSLSHTSGSWVQHFSAQLPAPSLLPCQRMSDEKKQNVSAAANESCQLMLPANGQEIKMHNLIFSSSTTASRCSACRPSTSPTSSISVTSLWGRSTSSPSSSWAVWSCCGSSRPPRLPSSSPWWFEHGSHPSPKIYKKKKQELFLQSWTFSHAGAGFGVCQEADGLHLQQEGAQLAGWPHAREQEEEAGGRWWGHWKPHAQSIRSLHSSVEVRCIDTGHLTMSPGRGRGGGAECRGGGRSRASAIRRLQVSWKHRFHRNSSEKQQHDFSLSLQRDSCHQHHRWNVQGLFWKHVERQQLRILQTI